MFRFILCLILSGQVFAQSYDVIVVGAGMSGLAAAATLKVAGLQVLVLEARDHIGGRTHTVGFPNHPDIFVDLGAAWIEGTKGNPLIPLAEKYGAPNKQFNYDLVNRYDTTAGQNPPLSPLDNDVFDMLEDQMEQQVRQAKKRGQEMSMLAALDPWIKTFPQASQYDLYYLVTSDIEHDYGCDASDLSLLNYDEDEGFGGPDNLMINGYQPLIDGLAADLLNSGSIKLNQVVTEISYPDEGVLVTANGVVYHANYVICSVPLGILKNRSIAFSPPLPEWKQAAIDRLKMGILDKTVLLFPTQFWDARGTLIDRIPLQKGQWVETINYQLFNNAPMIVAFNAGTVAQQLVENQSDEAVIASIMSTLRSIYGNAIPDPIDHIITRWGQDPFSFGSYSHVPPGASLDDYDTLAKPIGRLHFAGEATTRYIATAHGAYLSGVREANAILYTNCLKND